MLFTLAISTTDCRFGLNHKHLGLLRFCHHLADPLVYADPQRFHRSLVRLAEAHLYRAGAFGLHSYFWD